MFVLWGKYKDGVYLMEGIGGKWEGGEVERMGVKFYGKWFKWGKEKKR